jgi:osmotically-inducible protein OsmY
MRSLVKPVLAPALILCLAPALSGCVAVVATGVVAGVSAARQERTIGNAVDDVRIKSSLTSSLEQQSATNFVNVSTTVVEGRVLLTGRVTSPEARLDASRAAWDIEGVRKVDNDIQVTEDGRWLNRPSDIYVRTKLAADLLIDPDVRDVNYTIDVVDGTVYLMGVAQNQAEIDKVVADAHDISQVKAVQNYVVLKTDPIRYGMASAEQRHMPASESSGDEGAPAAAPHDAVSVSPEPPANAGSDTYPDDAPSGGGEDSGAGATGAPAQLTH